METTTITRTQSNPSEEVGTTKTLRVLIVDDSENDVIVLLRNLRKAGYHPVYERVWTAPAMKAALQSQSWEIVISDFHMPNFGGFEALQLVKESGQDTPFILVSGLVGEETAVAAMKAGAQDYIMKRNPGRLIPAIERELREAQTRAARKAAEKALLQSEEQLRQAQKVEAVGLLASGVAHDFNNILTVIMGYSELLEVSKENNPQRRFVQELKLAADRGASLTRQLLAFSRKQSIEPKILDLNSVVAHLEKMLRRLLGEDIELRSVAAIALGSIEADPNQMEQVIMNLVVNARDAMPNGGTLTLKTANVVFDDTASVLAGIEPGSYIMLSITDTGTGMSDDVKAHLFEPFFTTKPQDRGTGLGLATSYAIVRQSHGHIKVLSELGRGTTFSIYLPRVEKAILPPCPVIEPCSGVGGSETLLVVEDEPAVRELNELILRERGYQVLSACDGLEALLLAPKTQPVDLLITDIVMPNLGGYELAKRLRLAQPDLKILFTSGHTGDKISPANDVQGTAFLQKPYRPEVLATKVRRMLDEKCLVN